MFLNYSNTPQSRQTGDISRYASQWSSIQYALIDCLLFLIRSKWTFLIDCFFFCLPAWRNSLSTPNLNVTSSSMGTTPNNTFGSNSNIAGSISSTAMSKPPNTQGALNDGQVFILFNAIHRHHHKISKFSIELKLQSLSSFLITTKRNLFPESFQSSIPIIPQRKKDANSNCYSSNSNYLSISKPTAKIKISELILNKIENFQKFQSAQNIQANITAATNSTQPRSTDMDNLISTAQGAYENHKFMSHGYDGQNYGKYLILLVFVYNFYWKPNFTIVLICSKR